MEDTYIIAGLRFTRRELWLEEPKDANKVRMKAFAGPIATGLCKAKGTGQCAPLCLRNSSLTTGGGMCPDRLIVWRREVHFILSEFLKP